jgi:hypothetical protein
MKKPSGRLLLATTTVRNLDAHAQYNCPTPATSKQ